MKITLITGRNGKRALAEIDDVRLIYRNFEGRGDKYNTPGNRNFSILIPDQEKADILTNDLNEYGVGWKVKIKPPREEGEEPFIHMPVNVKYTDRSGPVVYLISGKRKVELTEETIGMLDDIDIENVRLDVRPYDGEGVFGPFRSAYLQSMEVVQKIDRFAAEYDEFENADIVL